MNKYKLKQLNSSSSSLFTGLNTEQRRADWEQSMVGRLRSLTPGFKRIENKGKKEGKFIVHKLALV